MNKFTANLGDAPIKEGENLPNLVLDSSTWEYVYSFMLSRPNEKLLHFYLNPVILKDEQKVRYNLEIFTETR